ncbi:hypothetical protein GCM10010862_05980 [Devosia nitrariae]|uniref:Metallo-beta-lactamase domain-containing protein n=1 Tax=Devosia nitrariae TaxID=2071872 RepID=A0ABQ5W0B0_9HYPH|nr:hypothetical protein GCM10010862_05980 [Devosia nitrariae]
MQHCELHQAAAKPAVTGFFEPRTGSIQYIVADPGTHRCAIIDPVLDFDEKSGTIRTVEADKLLRFIADNGYEVEWILDTHPHADHCSAAQYLKEKTGAPTAIGEKVTAVQTLWQGIYNLPEPREDGSQGGQTLRRRRGVQGGQHSGKGHTLAGA